MPQIFPPLAFIATDGIVSVNSNTINFVSGATVSNAGNGIADVVVTGPTLPAISSTRTIYSGATPSIANLASADITISADDMMMIGRIATDVAATVRLYSSTASLSVQIPLHFFS